ncbi:MAG: phosphotransferase [Desulfobacteraceae bacterium]|nr:phosphotransferase [Desulfobacteraceae bacterium]
MQEFFDNKNNEFPQWLNNQWNIEFKCTRDDIDIEGSPERTLSRVVIQDTAGNLFLLEEFVKDKYQIRKNVATAIEFLNNNGLKQALPYQKSNFGKLLPFYKETCFQISPFLSNTGLDRPDYLASEEMGKNFALFLIDQSKASVDMRKKISFKPFSIKKYIYKIFSEMNVHDIEVYNKYLPFLKFLEKDFMAEHDKLPTAFVHGDLHPLNVIWDNNEIKAVIDWEFTGFKPDMYDAANLVGCAGIEDPEGLGMPMVMTFIKTLKEHGVISQKGWDMFPEYILALRFAWLSEWLRKKDEEMINLEACYLDILMENMDDLRKIWGI